MIELVAHRRPDVIFHLARPDRRARVGRAPGARRDRQHPRLVERVRGRARGRRVEGRVRGVGRHALRHARRGARARGRTRSGPSRRTASRRRRSATTCTTTAQVRGLEYTALALANVYGPRQDPHGEAGVVAIFAGKLLHHERPVIFGDGTQTRDFVYVDDVVDAFVRAVDKGGGLLMNIGTGVETRVQQLYDVMARLTGFKQPARYQPPRPGEIERSALDPARAEIHLGWKPWTSLDEGVARTLEHFKGEHAALPTSSLIPLT